MTLLEFGRNWTNGGRGKTCVGIAVPMIASLDVRIERRPATSDGRDRSSFNGFQRTVNLGGKTCFHLAKSARSSNSWPPENCLARHRQIGGREPCNGRRHRGWHPARLCGPPSGTAGGRYQRAGWAIGACESCGGRVYAPCRLCRIRRLKAAEEATLRAARRQARQEHRRRLLAAVRKASEPRSEQTDSEPPHEAE